MKKTLVFWLILGFFPSLPAQILNGSFEKDTLPDLDGWKWTCFAESEKDAPAGGGSWCLKVFSGNFQGCWPGYAYQKLPDVTGDRAYYLTGWARRLTSPTIGIYFGTINKGVITLQEGDTTSSTEWKPLGVSSQFHLAEGDTAAIILWGGQTGGPVQGYGLFDRIDLEPITSTEPVASILTGRIFPNPVNDRLRILPGRELPGAGIRIVSLTGQTVAEQSGISGHDAIIDCSSLPEGMYFLQIRQGQSPVQVFKLLIKH